ncbi:MAG TPA: DUF1565 domain-containing protein, partial [Polyangiaceae bacterium]|nr:DUF1565 domain-containing protein [Polyangiaceae bacterium]
GGNTDGGTGGNTDGGTGGGTSGAGGSGGSGGSELDDWQCEAAPGGTEIYLSLNGDDTNAGTLNAPYATFGRAIQAAKAGDVIYVRAGTYGKKQAMVRGVARDEASYPATKCPDGEVLADKYCYHDTYAFIALQDFSGWASNTPSYTVESGTKDHPIAICPYPGEHVTLDATGWTMRAVTVGLKAHWIIAHFEIIGGMVNIGGGNANAQPHDIVIRGNNVHDITIEGGDNPGIVRIDRGDVYGPWNIFVWGNELHDLYDIAQPGQWQNVQDAQHFGAVTTLSRQTYSGFDGGGTEYIEIIGNTMYNLPQAFFFKNPMEGPIEIRHNIIRNAGSLGLMMAANVHMVHNLVSNVSDGWQAGNGGYDDDRITAISGQNAVIEYNTFVGLDSMLQLRCATGHQVQHNIIAGLSGSTKGANWDTPSFVSKQGIYPDPLDPAHSILQNMTSNHNCFISPHADFQLAARYLPQEVTGNGWLVEHYDHAHAKTTFGFDIDSVTVVEANPSSLFLDPDAGDFQLIDPNRCPNMGYHAYPGDAE